MAKQLTTVTEYNAKQTSFHMTFHSNSGKKYTRGFVVIDENGASQYCKNKKEADKVMSEPTVKTDDNYVAPSEREYDWGVDMSYRLTGKGSEHLSLTK
jgi:hypothetical protein